jgi:pimeloyl-ACP methyl ester carboxylesterase
MTSRAFDLAVQVRGKGFPVLCLHGHPGSSGSMSVFTNHLSQRFMTLAPDLRGYGKSQTRQNFEMTDHLTDLEALCDRYHLDEFILLGWSLGGIIAMELALKFPDRVKGMILIATAARPHGNHPPISWQDNLFTGIAALANQIQPSAPWHIELFGKRSLYRYLIQQHTAIAYQYLAVEATAAFLQTSAAANRALNQALNQRYNRLAEISQIQCPTLVLAGAEDRHITAQSSLETAQNIPNSQAYCYPNVAHLFPWEIPERVLGDIDQWLEQFYFRSALIPNPSP